MQRIRAPHAERMTTGSRPPVVSAPGSSTSFLPVGSGQRDRGRKPASSEEFVILHVSLLGFVKIHMSPHTSSMKSVEITEVAYGPVCILAKPNDEAYKIANISLGGRPVPIRYS
jgi:hypothetical protein